MGVGATGSETDRYPADSATDPAVMADRLHALAGGSARGSRPLLRLDLAPQSMRFGRHGIR
jgi:hypothetical protein